MSSEQDRAEQTAARGTAAAAASAARDAVGREPGGGEAAPARWWGTHPVPRDHARTFRIGPLTLRVRRSAGEWRVAYDQGDDPLDATVCLDPPAPGDDLLDRKKLTRYAMDAEGEAVRLEPRLADRSVVSKPERPFVLLGRSEVRVHISTPIWVAVFAGDPEQLLLEVPTFRPSDTWMGPDTQTGELAYTNRAALRIRLEKVPLRPHRAVTEVVLRNGGEEAIPVERLSLPVRYLSVFEGADGNLWTQRMVFEREPGSDHIQLRLRDSIRGAARRRARQDAPERRLCEPREPFSERLGLRALTSLFG